MKTLPQIKEKHPELDWDMDYEVRTVDNRTFLFQINSPNNIWIWEFPTDKIMGRVGTAKSVEEAENLIGYVRN